MVIFAMFDVVSFISKLLLEIKIIIIRISTVENNIISLIIFSISKKINYEMCH